MVLALVYFHVTDSQGFLEALGNNTGSMLAAPGYVSHALRRGVEQPNRYLLSIEWQSVQHHTEWQKAHAKAFLEALGPHLERDPDIEHFVAVGS